MDPAALETPVQDSAKTNPPAPGRKRRFGFLRRLPLYLLLAYIMWLFGSCSLQERLIYPRQFAQPGLLEVEIPGEVQRVWITAADGSKVEAWFVPAADASPDHPAPAAIFFHGNAELIDHNLDIIDRYQERGYSILMPEYRGYGRSAGRPNQANIVADADQFYAWLVARPDVDKTRIVIHGRSLGTGVAAQLAALHPPAALILESPFTSIASFTWRYGVPPIFLRSPFYTDRVLPELTCPILLLAGRSDEIVPIEHSHKLHELAPSSTMVELDGSHNSGLSTQKSYWDAVDKVLAKVAKKPSQ
jgi:fermentation-respiration switch protein FrsA (DUF1100 family)